MMRACGGAQANIVSFGQRCAQCASADSEWLPRAQHLNARADLLNKGQKGSVENVKSNAQIRKDLKELVDMKAELERVHEEEEKKALKKAKTVRLDNVIYVSRKK
eukprot:SAG31_NODE_1440_length_8331_cov_4.818270_2_plen_105_part_00